jgi:YidC/Oxa1 family membrane protein insertase
MGGIFQVLSYPFGWVMWALYAVVRNYGVALLIFTVLIKVALFPLSLKQQKSSAKMMTLQPQINDLQNRYKNDKQKLNEEMMNLYQKEKYNPMSGCLPALIPMPILFALIDVIYRPLYHILRLPQEVIDIGTGILEKASAITATSGVNAAELVLIRGVNENPSAFAAMGADVIEKIQGLNLSFFWMDLTQTPSMSMFGEIFSSFNPVILIPIISGVTSLLASLQLTRNQPQAAGGGMKGMMLMMPLFSTWIAFSVPAGVGLYWIYSNVLSMLQAKILNKIYNPKEIAAKAKQELEERQERERLERIEAKKQLREAAKKGNLTGEELPKNLSAKELNRRKLAEARKRDAEKYGEEYVEVTDDDLI